MEIEMEPKGDYILVEEHERVEKTKHGIIMLDGVDGNWIYGNVIKVGPGLYSQTGKKIPMTTKVGDIVVLHKSNAGDQKRIKLDDKEYILVREHELYMGSKS